MIDEFLKALDNDKEYDFIANHYHEMSKSDLKDILLEYIYASEKHSDVKESVNDELTANSVFGE